MKITKAKYIINDGYPALVLVIDGKEALIGDFKKDLLDMGYVPLGSRELDVDWEETLPKIKLPKKSPYGDMVLKGFTNDHIILKLAHDFYNAVNHLEGKKFIPGDISIPEL